MYAALATFVCTILFSQAVVGEEEFKNMEVDMEVKLGFEQFPDGYTCEGKDISPQIVIKGVNATSLAMIMDDPDAPIGTYTHWIIWNMPPIEVIPEDFPKNATVLEPFHAFQGNNSAGEIGYLGPCPPPGKSHRYFFRLYGLDTMLDLQPNASRQDLEEAMQGHVMQKGEAMATYRR